MSESSAEPPAESPTDAAGKRDRGHTVHLVVVGIVYLLLTLVWMWAVTANQVTDQAKFDASMRKFGEFFAIVAAPLWFFTTLNQVRSHGWRIAILLLGLVLLVPLPLFFGVSPL